MIAAIYARKSTEQSGIADEAKSVGRQTQHARAYAERKGWTVADEHVYVDDGISGAEFAKRPGFLRLMNALKPRAPFQVLVMSEESRLGRESIETAYALKQLVTADVRVFFYLEDRERTLDSPTDKIMMSLTAFADELEREKARQRTYDAMAHKARAGHVTGGRTFGYDNVRIDTGGVRRVINDPEAAIVRRIFELCAQGHGMRQIAQRLNAESAASPRAQQGRPKGWSPSSVREVLYRETYRGVVVWNKTQKRNAWGQIKVKNRSEAEWLRRDAPELRIVDEPSWAAAHARLAESRALYLRSTDGQLWGQPARGTESKYLLVGLARCAVCGSGLSVRSRSHGSRRAYFYVCTGYHLRGRHVCTNGFELPMEATNAAVLTAVGEQVLTPAIVEAAVARAVERLERQPSQADHLAELRTDRAVLDGELVRLTTALASGGDIASVLDAIKSREARRKGIDEQLLMLSAVATLPRVNRPTLTAELRRRLEDWRQPLSGHVAQARQLLRKIIIGRLSVTPDAALERSVTLSGDGTLLKLVDGAVYPKGVASPAGFEPAFWP